MMNYIVKFTDSNIKNIILNICILLFGINFLYKCNYIVFGTFVLLVIFKKFKINLGNKFTLLILVLFSICWYIFGGHEIAGVCLPICYLIGSNIDESDEKGITKFIILIAASLALYTTSFFINNGIINGFSSYNVETQYNIWNGNPLWPTNIMLYSSLFSSICGYIVFYEKNKKMKILYFIILFINMFYALMLGRRTALLMVCLSMLISFIYIMFFDKTNNKKKIVKISLVVLFIILIICLLLVVCYIYNIFNFKNIVEETNLYIRYSDNIFKFFNDAGRTKIRKKFLSYFWQYPWGGSKIHNFINNYAHDLWLDVYDVAGIITFIVMIVYTIVIFTNIVKLLLNKSLNMKFRLLLLSLFICIFVQFCIEPILEACRAYMFAVCMIFGSLERLNKNV